VSNEEAKDGNNNKDNWENPRIVWAFNALSVDSIEAISASGASLVLVLKRAYVTPKATLLWLASNEEGAAGGTRKRSLFAQRVAENRIADVVPPITRQRCDKIKVHL